MLSFIFLFLNGQVIIIYFMLYIVIFLYMNLLYTSQLYFHFSWCNKVYDKSNRKKERLTLVLSLRALSMKQREVCWCSAKLLCIQSAPSLGNGMITFRVFIFSSHLNVSVNTFTDTSRDLSLHLRVLGYVGCACLSGGL